MKRLFLLFLVFLMISACGDDAPEGIDGVDFRQEMRDFVQAMSFYSKTEQPGFLIIPQNGVELVTTDGEEDGPLDAAYAAAIDGHGQEDLFYGYNNDDQASPANETNYLRAFLDLSKAAGNVILVTDYCSTPSKMDGSYSASNTAGYISFAADHRELDNIPAYPANPYQVNPGIVTSLSGVQNFLYLINPENFTSRTHFINMITATNYDLLIMDLFFKDGVAFTAQEVDQLRNKGNGGERLLICYMSVGEAEDYRYYWESAWNNDPPSWMDGENPDWDGNFKVRYWEQGWQDIIFGTSNAYLDKVLDAGFDGVYLDIIDAYEYYESF